MIKVISISIIGDIAGLVVDHFYAKEKLNLDEPGVDTTHYTTEKVFFIWKK